MIRTAVMWVIFNLALYNEAVGNVSSPLKVGMSSVFSGPSQGLGINMRLGIEAAFAHANNAGGIHGRRLELLSLDDGYEPSKAGPNMRQLIEKDQVFAIIGNVGTPTATVAVPIANQLQIPFFGAFTGAGMLRKTPPDRWVINYRASYAEETGEMVRGFLSMGIKPGEIGFFTQNDSYGDSGYLGGIKALKALGYLDAEKAPHGRYTRNSEDVEDGLSRLMDPRLKVKAVIMVGAYKPCAKFIRLAKKLGFKAYFANVSFVGSDQLAKELGTYGEGVVVTQVVPHYQDRLPIIERYRKLVKSEDINFVSLEGFIVGQSFVEILKKAGENPTKDSFIDAAESGDPIDVGLISPFKLSKIEHQLSHSVWPTYIKNGKFVPLKNWNDLN